MRNIYKKTQKIDIPGIISFILVIFVFIFFFSKSIIDIRKYKIISYRGEVISKIQKIMEKDTLYWIEIKQYNKEINGWNFFKLRVDKSSFDRARLGRRLNPIKTNEKIN